MDTLVYAFKCTSPECCVTYTEKVVASSLHLILHDCKVCHHTVKMWCVGIVDGKMVTDVVLDFAQVY
jgi:hypothetical protein